MQHFFFTRLAVRMVNNKNLGMLLNTRSKKYDNIQDRLNDIISYWQKYASKFYDQQTVDDPFHVYLIYSPAYVDIVKSFDYPKWVTLTTDTNIDRCRNLKMFIPVDNNKLSISRIDADDWYSSDYFEYLNRDFEFTYPGKNLTVHLHKWVVQLNRLSTKLSTPCHFKSPPYGTFTFNKFDLKHIPLNMPLWPHGNLIKYKHIIPKEIYALQSVGLNVINKWRHSNKFADKELCDRFHIPSQIEI